MPGGTRASSPANILAKNVRRFQAPWALGGVCGCGWGWEGCELLCACTKGPQQLHTLQQHPATPQQPTSSPQTAYMHARPTQYMSACCCVVVCVCVCVCVSGGETQPSVGVDLDRWHFIVMACPQGPSSCLPGHGCLHRGPRSPNMAVAELLVAVSGLHKHTVSWST